MTFCPVCEDPDCGVALSESPLDGGALGGWAFTADPRKGDGPLGIGPAAGEGTCAGGMGSGRAAAGVACITGGALSAGPGVEGSVAGEGPGAGDVLGGAVGAGSCGGCPP